MCPGHWGCKDKQHLPTLKKPIDEGEPLNRMRDVPGESSAHVVQEWAEQN